MEHTNHGLLTDYLSHKLKQNVITCTEACILCMYPFPSHTGHPLPHTPTPLHVSAHTPNNTHPHTDYITNMKMQHFKLTHYSILAWLICYHSLLVHAFMLPLKYLIHLISCNHEIFTASIMAEILRSVSLWRSRFIAASVRCTLWFNSHMARILVSKEA